MTTPSHGAYIDAHIEKLRKFLSNKFEIAADNLDFEYRPQVTMYRLGKPEKHDMMKIYVRDDGRHDFSLHVKMPYCID